MADESVKLFFSYSHKDEALRDALANHLANLEWQKVISSWHDRKIVAGTEWDDEIKSCLDTADIILLLVSPDFIASKYCREIEILQAMQQHEAGKAYVIPVILRPFDWQDAPFAKLQAYPKDGKAVTLWHNEDEAFVSVVQGIRTVAKLLLEQRKQKLQQKEVARTQYLKKVEEVLSDGKISLPERDTLDELREELKLTLGEASEIETHAFEPFKRYEGNLQKYKQTLIRIIQQEYPISDETNADLKLCQRDLGLKAGDVERIEQPIFAEAEVKYREKLEQEKAERELQETDQDSTLTKVPTDSLISGLGINYRRLHDLLAARRWSEANQETMVIYT
ncbi:MAG: TIR domain-containing protein [Chroococcidiopsidaceae cyanobacterium CP_BM_RX_35]|nr:TIR domain-containing protein [Chroococcidiopsidaceae cyanobacterium CP_BM_RX_35]